VSHPGPVSRTRVEAILDDPGEGDVLANGRDPDGPAGGAESRDLLRRRRQRFVRPAERRLVSYTVRFGAPHELTDGDATTLVVDDYEDVGSMYIFELSDGTTRSVGKQLVESVTDD
jgi:hypothetical protein